jgi:O-antigen/teichoic acid export membrane protein
VLLTALGIERFGLWALLWAITGSLGLLDLRLSAAVTTLVAQAVARGEERGLTRLVSAALAFYFALGILEVGVAILCIRSPAFLGWIPTPLREEARPAIVWAVVVFATNSLTSVFTGLLYSVQRFDVVAKISVGLTLTRAVLLISIALSGGGLRELLFAEGVIACLNCVICVWAVRQQLPDLPLFGLPSSAALRELIRFGGKLQIAHAAYLVTFHADKLLLSAFLGLAAVAYYDLGSKIALFMRGIPLLLVSATGPVASVMQATGERSRLSEFYFQGTRALVFAATPLWVFTMTGAGAILLAWAGVTAPEARQAVWLLAIGFYLNLVSGMANSVAVGMGKPELEMRRSLLAGSLNLLLSAALIPLIGFSGAPLGTAIALAIGSWYLMRRVNAEFGHPFSSVIECFRLPLLGALPAAGGALLVLTQAGGHRSSAVVALLGSALIIGAIYLWIALRGGVVRVEWLWWIPIRLKLPFAKL